MKGSRMAVEAEKRYPVPPEELARFGSLGREGSTLTVLRHARIAEKMGLSGTDHKALDLVRQAEGALTAGRIAELTGLSTGAVTGWSGSTAGRYDENSSRESFSGPLGCSVRSAYRPTC